MQKGSVDERHRTGARLALLATVVFSTTCLCAGRPASAGCPDAAFTSCIRACGSNSRPGCTGACYSAMPACASSTSSRSNGGESSRSKGGLLR